MLILLQPGIQPLGQFDLDDAVIDSVTGGEVAYFVDASDEAAADVTRVGPDIQLTLGYAGKSVFTSAADGDPVEDAAGTVDHAVWGLIDEGSSAGLGGRGYGTMFGQVIGATVGQGTGLWSGAAAVSGEHGTVVVGPSTIRGSGKATLWTKPGLYGVTQSAFDAANFSGASFNAKLFGTAATGKLTDANAGPGFANGGHVGYFLGQSNDSSLVSTTSYYAGGSAAVEFAVVYLVGCL